VKTVSLCPHEFVANALFDGHGLDPFFACDSQVKAGGGSVSGGFETEGETWRVRLSYQSSNIVHPGSTTPQGTSFEVETIREYRFKVKRDRAEDAAGQQSFVAHIAPRWVGMEGERDDGSRVEIPVPEEFGEGVNVRLTGSNIAFDRYLPLLQKAARAVGIAPDYFADPHESSNVQDAERYVRVHRDASGPVHARDGPIAALGHLLEHDRQGYRKVVQDDDDHHGENLPGYYHTVTLGPRRVREAFPDHRHPKEVKHYYAKEAGDRGDDDPLAHPKVGASLQMSQVPNDKTVYLDDLAQLREELDQTVLSVLADAGTDVAPGEGGRGDLGAFVEDAYFEPVVEHGGPDPVGLDLTRIQQEQESVVIRHLADGGFSPVQLESLETLVTDGGEIAPEDIADDHDRHPGSVRRALREMDDLVHREYAQVSLRSEYVAELVHEAVEEASEAFERATDAAATALEAADRGLDETASAFLAWAAKHGVDVDGAREARMKLRFQGTDSLRERVRAIKEGFDVWQEAGMDPAQYRQARIQFANGAQGVVWQYLRKTT